MKSLILSLLFIFLLTKKAFSGRPFITDDAAVVGEHQFQLETWLFWDKRSLQHWIVPTVGIGNALEVSVSGVHGVSYLKDEAKEYSYAGPIIQGKLLVKDMGYDIKPSLAIAGGIIPSLGEGYFESPASEYYYYLAGTSYLLRDESIIFHFNIGRQTRRQQDHRSSELLWGIALDFKVHSRAYVFAEATNGDIYAIIPGTASQCGFRFDLNNSLQIDATLGTGLNGRPSLPFWATAGIKYVTDIL